MSKQSQEAKLFLAIQAFHTTKNPKLATIAGMYNVSRNTLRNRLNGSTSMADRRHARHNLTLTEEETIASYILNLDSRGFSPRIDDVRDMANLLLATRRIGPVGKQWPYRFVRNHPKLKTRLSRSYDYQRALCEDPNLINDWFRLVANMRAKYGIDDTDLYNFDETGFMMGIICSNMVVTRTDRRGKPKKIQPGNREWATAIECVSADGFVLPPFLLVQGKNHLASWYTECDLPPTWIIKPTANGWTDNNTALEWIQHFNKHTLVRRKGAWRMIVLDGHESHQSAQFEEYCKEHKIITICLPAHSSHLTQPLDVGCFSVLKKMYGKELEAFIKAHIHHITKTEFFIAFKAAHIRTFTNENVLAGFQGSGLVPYNPEAVLLKLDIKLRTPTPTGNPPLEADPWVSQTPHNPAEAISQSAFVRNRITNYQGSSPTSIFAAVEQMVKGTELIAHGLTLFQARAQTLEEANKALSKRRRAKRTRVQEGGLLSVEDAHKLIAEKEAVGSKRRKTSSKEGEVEAGLSASRRCSNCGKAGHNVRTCQTVEETSSEDSDVQSN